MRRFLVFAAASALLLGGLVSPARAGGSSHPYFDDQGTLTWYHGLEDAKRAARREGKVIFVEYGRRRCGSCRMLVSSVVPDPRVRDRLARAAVGLAAECDRPEPVVQRMFARHLAGARMLPFVAFLDADGSYITGFAGSTSVGSLLAHLRRAEAYVGRAVALQPPRVAPTAPPCVSPTAPPCVSPTAPPCAAPAGPPAVDRDCIAPPAPHYPPPRLEGDPDAADVPAPVPMGVPERNGCCAPSRPPRTGPLPPPRIVINPPVKVKRPPPAVRTQPRPAPVDEAAPDLADAERAAREGRWGRVLESVRAAPESPRATALRQQAHAWAQRELDAAVQALSEARYEDALASVKAVLLQMNGEPEGVDAESGLVAIRTLLELRFLDAAGPVAPVVRQNTYEDLRGTRWARLFSS